MNVIKRNGTRKPWDIIKIRKQIEPACKGTSVNPLEFESMLKFDISKTIKSTEIQDTLILVAKNNITVDTPDYNIVAGRLLSYQMSRQIWKNSKKDFSEYSEVLKLFVRNGNYRSDLLSFVTDKQLDDLSKYMDESRDYNVLLSQALLLQSKYLIKNKKGIVEYPSHADMTNSIILASDEVNKMSIIKEYYDMLSNYILSLATPFKSNLRLPFGNTGSCFVGEDGDSLYQIFKGYADKGVISKEGGGIGWYLGKIRPGDTWTQGVPKSNKITKWTKIINDIAVAVNQRGIRKGAITPALDWWHLDIIDFIEMKSELNGDLRDKSFDLFPQVVVDAYFVDAVLESRYVYKYNQYDFKKITGLDITELIGDELYQAHQLAEQLILDGKLKHFEKVKANELWKQFLWAWVEYGDFYITPKDNLNLSNYIKYRIDNKIVIELEDGSERTYDENSEIELEDGSKKLAKYLLESDEIKFQEIN